MVHLMLLATIESSRGTPKFNSFIVKPIITANYRVFSELSSGYRRPFGDPRREPCSSQSFRANLKQRDLEACELKDLYYIIQIATH